MLPIPQPLSCKHAAASSVLCALVLFACSSQKPNPISEPSDARRVTDESGKSVSVPAKIERFISLAPNLTEIAYAVGAGDRLVGNTTFCDYPDEAKKVQKVGDTLQPSIERILALRPQLVLVSLPQLEAFTKQLDEHRIAVYVTDPRDLEGVFRSIENLGRLLNQEQRAEETVSQLRQRATSVTEATKSMKPIRVFYQLAAEPLYTAGRDSFVTDLIRRAGFLSLRTCERGQDQQSAGRPSVSDYLTARRSHGSANQSLRGMKRFPALTKVYRIN